MNTLLLSSDNVYQVAVPMSIVTLLVWIVAIPRTLKRSAELNAKGHFSAADLWRAPSPIRAAFSFLCFFLSVIVTFNHTQLRFWESVLYSHAGTYLLHGWVDRIPTTESSFPNSSSRLSSPYVTLTRGRLDQLVSDATAANLTILRRNGYSSVFCFRTLCVTTSSGLLNVILSIQFLAPDATKEAHYDLRLLAVVALNLALSDVAFFLAHRSLHRVQSMAWIHHMHHCCMYSSWTSGSMFHPVDLAIEFSGPILIAILSSLAVLKDPFSFVITVVAIGTWYGMDHEEWLNLPHCDHHKHIDSIYAIYSKAKLQSDKLNAKGDFVKNTVKRRA
mmetsp:Transcript_64255/g.139876  ORF Transcript_64255/g.139876 Transcript_64255/m.139876 type:complete len:332 (+) Transcript_64255:173-1168(+)|eukprot:CAMPEP_0175996334 /NCGR_PEP_ID=MMETSP0108-20121206/55614_1 /TAXON_ID=195067 ORGANISM="Goniomonas pacifica, Strain CCMP1869" /NCGR_SAMPLE_ID=MMETSP0108 /ASSEMBLY_ACC=CAM_ASM_000204 /LENGTH=331 /DNA_ID=CAMNT_0017328525 /DNA_START=180 /DNA_END=1175 /DNA_ORIENTATION=+